jgi:hypothetical protein
MPHEQMSTIENNPINTMEGNTLDTKRYRRTFEMPRRTLRRLLARGHVNGGLEKLLAHNGMLDSDGSVIVVMEGPISEPPDPPQQPPPGTSGFTVDLETMGLGEVTVYAASGTDLARMERKNLRFVKAVDLGSGMARAEQHLVALLEDVGRVARAEQRAEGTQAGRRFSPHRHTRGGSAPGASALALVADGFNPPSDVG